MTTPIERLSNLVVGAVESVSPDEVRVLLELDAPHATALNTGTPAALLRELPSLPSRQAILLGWATPIPVLVEVDELPDEQRPRSADPDFWDVWTLRSERPIDWAEIANDWSGVPR